MSKQCFDEMNTKGKVGEVVVADYLSSIGYTVINVSPVPEYQKKDIDLVIGKDGKSYTVEVKTDY